MVNGMVRRNADRKRWWALGFTGVLLLTVALRRAPVSAARRSVGGLTGCLKWRYDTVNSGWDPLETELTPASVGGPSFGKLWGATLQGQVYAQPLYVTGIAIDGQGAYNILLVATENDTVYALDADADAAPAPLWQTQLGSPVPNGAIGCTDINPEYGITSTPVVDPVQGVVYLTTETLEPQGQTWRVHALSLANGQELTGWGIPIAGSVVADGGGTVTFTPSLQLNRPGLILQDGRLYICFASHCDIDKEDYRGWVFSYDPQAPSSPPQLWCTTPDVPRNQQAAAGIWMDGASPAVDASGNLYVTTGNGRFDVSNHARDFGNSCVRLDVGGGGITGGVVPADYYAPTDQALLNARDLDFGSGGALLLPTVAGISPLLTGGKDEKLRLLNAENLGGQTNNTNPKAREHLLQVLSSPGKVMSTGAFCTLGGTTSVYINQVDAPLRQFSLGTARGEPKLIPVTQSPAATGYPSSTPVVSSSGLTAGTGLVWIIDQNTAALQAFDAGRVSTQLYSSNSNAVRDALASVIKFSVPLVANGRVYVGGDGVVSAFGLPGD